MFGQAGRPLSHFRADLLALAGLLRLPDRAAGRVVIYMIHTDTCICICISISCMYNTYIMYIHAYIMYGGM